MFFCFCFIVLSSLREEIVAGFNQEMRKEF